MPYSAIAVANYFLDLANSAGRKITPMKMQKLVYFAHGWCLAIYHKPLIEEDIMAWQFGPVIKPLYSAFREYGKSAITDFATDIDIRYDEDGNIDLSTSRGITPNIPRNSDIKKLLDAVWEAYGNLTAIQLSRLTHAENSPWSNVWVGEKDTVIDNDVIRNYFITMGESVKSTEASAA